MLVTGNFPTERLMMDMPITGTNAIFGTNYVTISTVSVNPPLKFIRVDCMWLFTNGRVYSNSVASYRSPGT